MADLNEDEAPEPLYTEMPGELYDQNKLIEAGWVAFLIKSTPFDAPPPDPREKRALRTVFFAGAQHVLAFERGEKSSEEAQLRSDLMEAEIRTFVDETGWPWDRKHEEP